MEDLVLDLKKNIKEALNLEHLEVTQIDTDAPLFGTGLGLDSIDALELIVLMEKKYGVKIKSAEEGKNVFQSIKTMADYISTHKK
ncbi:MAG TPA: phosphopantetheine-binding protein, partial [Cytophagaceae bacterium]|jgi:acyl carrier protein|nr:phosphopantetheine-binding protein [Cytophagaceae bacterium]